MVRVVLVFVMLALGVVAGARVSVSVPDALVFRGVEMVPVRPLAEIWGASLTSAQGVVTFTRGRATFSCTPGTTTARQNGRTVRLPLAPFVCDGATYVPLRALAAALGGRTTPVGRTALTVALPAPAAPLTFPRKAQRGTPARYKTHRRELYCANLDGTGRRRLTYNTVTDALPVFSPDGTRLLHRSGLRFVLRACDDPQVRFFPSETAPNHAYYYLETPAFTPDGREILFTDFRYTDAAHTERPTEYLCLADLSGRRVRTLGEGTAPVMSPDGRWIAFNKPDIPQSYYGQESPIYLMTRDGSQPRRLGVGSDLAFDTERNTLFFRATYLGKLWSCPIAADGTPGTPAPVFADKGIECERFTPDGTQVIYTRVYPANRGIFLANADGSWERLLTEDPIDALPRVSGDGRSVVFLRWNTLCCVNTDGTRLREIARGNWDADIIDEFVLTPDGRQVIYKDYTR